LPLRLAIGMAWSTQHHVNEFWFLFESRLRSWIREMLIRFHFYCDWNSRRARSESRHDGPAFTMQFASMSTSTDNSSGRHKLQSYLLRRLVWNSKYCWQQRQQIIYRFKDLSALWTCSGRAGCNLHQFQLTLGRMFDQSEPNRVLPQISGLTKEITKRYRVEE
jgi:hypothetical protein